MTSHMIFSNASTEQEKPTYYDVLQTDHACQEIYQLHFHHQLCHVFQDLPGLHTAFQYHYHPGIQPTNNKFGQVFSAWKGKDSKLHWYPKFYNRFLIDKLLLWVLNLVWFIIIFSNQIFQPMILNYRKVYFINNHWVCTSSSIYPLLSYPLRSLSI